MADREPFDFVPYHARPVVVLAAHVIVGVVFVLAVFGAVGLIVAVLT